MSDLTDRERFFAVLFNGPLLTGDAIVVLAGEDADERGNTATELFRQGAAPVIVCSGALHDPPRRISGDELAALLMSRGVAPDRLLVEAGSQHTGEQARHVVEMARLNDWKRLLLVASPYHLPRATLTFIKALGDSVIRLVPVPASQLRWWESPPGMTTSRLDLLTTEAEKVEAYQADVATWAEGVAYFQRWEGQ